MKQQPELTVTEQRTDALIPYARNAKIHTNEQVDQICKSIEEFGFNDPIAIWHNAANEMEIVEGHGRVLAASKLGLEVIPTICLDHLTDEQRRAYTHVHNQLNMNTGWDFETLDLDIEELGMNLDLDFGDFGFDFELEPLSLDEINDIVNEDEVLDVSEAAHRCKKGEIWQLGKHRLMCGSATDESDMSKLLMGGVVDLWLTDPPYGVEYVGKTSEALTIQNDAMDDDSFLEFLSTATKHAKDMMRPGASFYIFHADSRGHVFRNALNNNELTVRENLVWVKQTMVLGRQDYQWKHEPCLYGWKDGAAHSWYSDRKQTTVLEFDRPTKNLEHPTMKPIALLSYLIGNSTKKGDSVLDNFGGSGSTLMACEQMDRTCFTMELDPKYCDVIINRWEAYTGDKAVCLG